MKSFSYNKKEKLKSRTQLEAIFASGKSFSVFPVKVFYMLTDVAQKESIKAGVGVSARHFKKAVDRNRIKRLLREAYRLEKKVLQDQVLNSQQHIAVFFLCIDKEIPNYALLREKMKVALEKLVERLGEVRSEK